MPKTFLDFTQNGNLSGVRIIGYAGNKEISVSFESLAAAVYNYINKINNSIPVAYRYNPQSTVYITSSNTTTAMYLSSSVQILDINLPGDHWITLTKAGSCYDITTAGEILSTNKSVLCLGDWIYIWNNELSSYNTLYFQNTGSSIITVEEGNPEEPNGIEVSDYQNIIDMKEFAESVNATTEFIIDSVEDFNELITLQLFSVGSGLTGTAAIACQQYRRSLSQQKNEFEELITESNKARTIEEQMQFNIDAKQKLIDFIVSRGDNPCTVQVEPPPDESIITTITESLSVDKLIYDKVMKDKNDDPRRHLPHRAEPLPLSGVGL